MPVSSLGGNVGVLEQPVIETIRDRSAGADNAPITCLLLDTDEDDELDECEEPKSPSSYSTWRSSSVG